MAEPAQRVLEPTVYVGTFLHSTSLERVETLEDTAVGVDEHGVIEFVEKLAGDASAETISQRWPSHKVQRAPEGSINFWFPGFIDTHIHASQFPNAGIFGKTTLISWLHTYTFPLEASLKDVSKARLVYGRCVRSTLSHGTTTAAYFATADVAATSELARVCLAQGQRAFVGRCAMDTELQPAWYRDESAAAAEEASRASAAAIRALDPTGALVAPIVTPRFAPSCSEDLLRRLAELADAEDLRVQTHISENKDEVALVKEMFPASTGYADVYDRAGLLTGRTVLAHACHLEPAEVELVRRRGAAVSHCPASNSYLGSGLCPVRELLDAGITVGLGTDVSGGYSPSVLAAAREAGGVSRIRTAVGAADATSEDKDRLKLSVDETLFLATRGGAKCLGLEKTVGAFEVGMHWDAQLVDLGAVVGGDAGQLGGRGNVGLYDGMQWEEKLAKWVFCGDERNTLAVWVKGRLVSGGMA